MKIILTTSAFSPNAPIPAQYTGDGADLSPPLSWSDLPPGTQEVALIMDDPDAPQPQPWVHWVLYRLPPVLRSLPEGLPTTPALSDPQGAMQGKNSWGTLGYRGPAPPRGHGVHHYHFKLYALGRALGATPGLTKQELLAKMQGHILAQGELVGTYQR